MKKLNFIILAFFSILFSFESYAQNCQADFIMTPGAYPGQFVITDNSTPSSPGVGTGYFQTFNLGPSLSTGPNFSNGSISSVGGSTTVQFSYNGTYQINYYYNSPTCNSSKSDSIVINSFPISTPCSAGLIVTPGPTPASYIFTDNSVGDSFGLIDFESINDVTLTQANPTATVQFPINGSHYYSYHIVDTVAGCFDSISANINVTSYPCDAQSLAISVNPSLGQFLVANQSTYCHVNTLYTPGATQPSQTNGPYQNFYVSYTSNGTYPYNLVILDTISGCTDSISGYINVTGITTPNQCTLQAGITIGNGVNPGEYLLLDNSTGGPSFGYYETGFGSSIPVIPNTVTTATYPANGIYNYTYVVIDTNSNCSDTILGSITVTGIPPIPCQATISITPTGNPGEFIFTDASNSLNLSIFRPDVSSNVQYTINQGGSVTIQYPGNGIYTYSYAIWSWGQGNNCTDSISGLITVTGLSTIQPCTINAAIYPLLTSTPGVFELHNYSIGGNYSYFEGGFGQTINVLPNNTIPTISYPSDGIYNYTYVVIDTNSNCSDTMYGSITVTGMNSPGPCNLQAGLTISSGSNPGEYFFTDISNGGSSWNLYPEGSGPSLNLGFGQSVNYTYASNGTYNYIYYVSDSICADTLYGTISVTGINQGCNSNFILLQDSINNNQYYCWNNATNSNGSTAGLTYSWDFGDGSTSSIAYPTHVYTNLGFYPLCLTITETATGCTSTFCDTIAITIKAQTTTLNVIPAGTNLGIEEIETLSSIALYPNPSDGKFLISMESMEATDLLVSIVSLTGHILYKEMKTVFEGQNTLEMNQTELSDGVYLIYLENINSEEKIIIRMVKR
jgi:PKD repeat protein